MKTPTLVHIVVTRPKAMAGCGGSYSDMITGIQEETAERIDAS